MTEEHKIEHTWIDRSPGSGSLSWSEAKAIESSRAGSHDGRAETRTTFYASSSDSEASGRLSWEGLAAVNDDMYHPDRAKQNHESDQQRFVEILCTELECTEYQEDRVRWVLDDIGNLRDFYPTKSVESIALAAISLVVDAETESFDNRISNRDEFVDLLDDLDMSFSELWSIRDKIRDETSLITQ